MSKSVFEIDIPYPPIDILDTDALRNVISSRLELGDTPLVHEETHCMGAISEGAEVYLLTFRSGLKPVFARAIVNSYAGHIKSLSVTLV